MRKTEGAASSDSSGSRVVISRRDLCIGAGGAVALMAMGGLRFTTAEALVRPPGGQDESRLLSACVRCQKCYEACPRGAIAPAHLEDGVLQMRMPKMYFNENYCNFCAEENDGVPLCAKVCPTGALALELGASAENTVIGVAEIDTSTCLAYRATGCRFCYDACPYDAMQVDSMGQVSVIEDRCNGCGACESVCVSLKEGSISVGATKRAITVRPRG